MLRKDEAGVDIWCFEVSADDEVQRDVLDALLQMLLGKGLISRTIYDKSHEKILGTLDFPPFFWDNEAGKEDVYGSTENSC